VGVAIDGMEYKGRIAHGKSAFSFPIDFGLP